MLSINHCQSTVDGYPLPKHQTITTRTWIILSLLLLVAQPYRAYADSNKLINQGNGHAYQRFDTVKTWENAKVACANLGAHLATINSQEEQSFIVSNNLYFDSTNANNNIYLGAWLGATDAESEGSWKWITGEPMNSYSPGYGFDDYNEGQDYMVILPDIRNGIWNSNNANGIWGDAGLPRNDDEYLYLCEWENTEPVATLPKIDSITPIAAVLNQPTTFTLTGSNFTDGMGFTIADCESSNQEVGVGSDVQRSFECTPRGTAGAKPGMVKTAPGGEVLHSFDVAVQPTAAGVPVVVDVVPHSAQLDQYTEFTVIGGNLSSGMGFTIADCEYSSREVPSKATAISRTFGCTPRGTAGRKSGIVKTKPGQLPVYTFSVDVGAVAPPQEGSLQYNPNVIELGDDAIAALGALTDSAIGFKGMTHNGACVVPPGVEALQQDAVFVIGGIARKVADVQVNSKCSTLVTTRIPTPQELFDVIDVDQSLAITGDQFIRDGLPATLTAQASAEHPRKAINVSNTRDQFSFTFKNHVVYDADGKSSTTGDRLLLNGRIILKKPVLKVKLQYAPGFFSYPNSSTISFKAGEVIDKLTLSSSPLRFRKVTSIPLGSFPVPIAVSGGSVQANVSLSLVFDASGEAKIKATLNQQATLDISATVQLADDAADMFSAQNKSTASMTFSGVEVLGQAKANLDLRGAIALRVLGYEFAGLNDSLGPHFLFSEKVSTAGSCMELGVSANVAASVYAMVPKVAGDHWLDYQFSLEKKTQQVFNTDLASWQPALLNGCSH